VSDPGTPAATGPSLPGWGQERYAGWVRSALDAAAGAAGTAEVPVGAVVLDGSGQELGRGHNLREASGDPTAHAEVVALRAAGAALGRWRLEGCTLAVTLEPCAMCAGAAVLARVERIVFGAFDPKAGACGSVWDLPRDRRSLHRPEVVGGVLEEECAALLLRFFEAQRLG
jgi:tRNA(adenine34) deaminase